jgi:3-hydroxyisobutyrate dehydrogenase-like beta-hydroxyacid dehydrogenase
VPDLVIGLLHPGEMGAAVGGCLAEAGHTVCWASDGRGPDTAARARRAGLSDAGTVAALAARSDVIVSVCPPHAATEVARAVTASRPADGRPEASRQTDGRPTASRPADGRPGTTGFGGVFVDANAISPDTSRSVAGIVEAGGASYVDGGIIGLPPPSAGGTRLYLSGPRAGDIRDLFAGTGLDARIVDDRIGSASTVKMAYAAWTKGTAALLLAARALAAAEGVQDALLTEWALSQPDLADRTQRHPLRPAPRPARGGAGWPRWRRSPTAWPRPGCRTDSTTRRPRYSAASPAPRPTARSASKRFSPLCWPRPARRTALPPSGSRRATGPASPFATGHAGARDRCHRAWRRSGTAAGTRARGDICTPARSGRI